MQGDDLLDIRSQSIFEDSHRSSSIDPLTWVSARSYSTEDVVALAGVILLTLLVDRYILRRGTPIGKLDDVTRINQAYRDLNTREDKIRLTIQNKIQTSNTLHFV